MGWEWGSSASKETSGGGGGSTIASTQKKIAILWHDEAAVVVGGAITPSIQNANLFNVSVTQATPADADSFSQSILLQAGDYTFTAIGETDIDRGKLDWAIDDVVFASGQDWYAGATGSNTVKTAYVTIATSGIHKLTGTVNGKNAGSSGYKIVLQQYYFVSVVDSNQIQNALTCEAPTRWTCWHDEATVLTGGAISGTLATLSPYTLTASQATPLDADSFTHSICLRAGTYTFSVMGDKNTDCGKIDWKIDSDAPFITGQDWYAAAPALGAVQTGSVAIVSSGVYKLTGTVNGKNAGSSGYAIRLQKYWFKLSADAAVTADSITPLYPKRQSVSADALRVIASTPYILTVSNSLHYNYAFNNSTTSLDGDELSCSIFLAAGTYTFTLLGNQFSARGKFDFYVDGTAVVTGQDWYNAGSVLNVATSDTFVLATSGVHLFRIKTNGKNVGASAYSLSIAKIWFKQATD